MNLFGCFVGRSSRARKGVAKNRVLRLYEDVDSDWKSNRITAGLSSGEGLIYAVRDPLLDDPGVSDKRLLVIEPEFASPLRMMRREGNVLGATTRQAWDDGDLRTLTKNSPLRATGAHISIIGHITMAELKRELTATDAANGFGNRFIWVCVKRANELPDGGNLNPRGLESLILRLKKAYLVASRTGRLTKDGDACALWDAFYRALPDDTGLAASVCARAEAQVLRLACVYALLDESAVINCSHLLAAISLWEFAEASVRFIFGDALGDHLADLLLSALSQAGPAGLTKTEMQRGPLAGHGRRDEVDRALALLARRGLAVMRKEESGGRPTERWVASGGRSDSQSGELTSDHAYGQPGRGEAA